MWEKAVLSRGVSQWCCSSVVSVMLSMQTPVLDISVLCSAEVQSPVMYPDGFLGILEWEGAPQPQSFVTQDEDVYVERLSGVMLPSSIWCHGFPFLLTWIYQAGDVFPSNWLANRVSHLLKEGMWEVWNCLPMKQVLLAGRLGLSMSLCAIKVVTLAEPCGDTVLSLLIEAGSSSISIAFLLFWNAAALFWAFVDVILTRLLLSAGLMGRGDLAAELSAVCQPCQPLSKSYTCLKFLLCL